MQWRIAVASGSVTKPIGSPPGNYERQVLGSKANTKAGARIRVPVSFEVDLLLQLAEVRLRLAVRRG